MAEASAPEPVERIRPSVAILRQLCPTCRRGKIFRGLLRMHETCPVCGLAFLREPGYFTGAMYISYALAVPLLGLVAWILHLLRPDGSFAQVMAWDVVCCLPAIPLLFRYSRVLWIHFDRWVD